MKKSGGVLVSTKCELVPVARLAPSAYNPRLTDPARLALIELSIRKLGWLLPIYATPEGEILSGHQRHLVAQRMGLKLVPVTYTENMPLPERKAINIVFNRGTNDLQPWETPKNLTEALEQSNVHALAKAITDKRPGQYEFYRCLQAVPLPVKDLARINAGHWKQHAANVSRALQRRGIDMPIIVTPDQRVVNGIGRLQNAAKLKKMTVEAVQIPANEATLAGAMLNLLSMDFDLHRRYKDLLRFNSFRRARRTRAYLGRGMVFAVVGSKPANTLDIMRPAHRARWTRVYGEQVLDFGAGHLHETELLRKAGIHCTPFEPYRLGEGAEIDKRQSIELTKAFLVAVPKTQWSSIFISSVLNSVPFEEDRAHIVRICAALCGPGCKVYAAASSTQQTDWKSAMGAQYLNSKDSGTLSFALDYEDGIKLGEFSSKPKVQKYHTAAEFKALFKAAFERVQVQEVSNNVEDMAADPKPLDRRALRKALEFEFDLPYPDGSRMGLALEARRAFAERLGVTL